MEKRERGYLILALLALSLLAACATTPQAGERPAARAPYDLILRGGTVYDGSGAPGRRVDVAVRGDRIAAMGDLASAGAEAEIDVTGLAVAPGFINMLSWADESLLVDGRSLSDIVQGVTLEVFGEGWSMGPLSPEMRRRILERQTDLRFDVPWTTLGEYLQHLETSGVSTNVASFVGAGTVRIHEIGYEDREATPQELERMRALVRQAMEEGALGVGSSLPYIPATFATTEELIALAEVAGEYGGMYISHIRDEGERLFEAIDEFLAIVRESGVSGEIYHLKAGGRENWDKLEQAIGMLESARSQGLAVSADIYPYHASSTGLTYVLPDWVQEGGHEKLVERLRDPEVRQRLPAEMDMIPPEDILLVGFRNPELRHLTGKTLAEVAAERGITPETAVMDLVVEDDSRIQTVRFTMSEENVRRKLRVPWVSLCSDAASVAPEPPFTNSQPHPRTYGSFSRLLGRYVREEGVLTLEDAIHRVTGLPAGNLKLDRRGLLDEGYFADIVVFDPETILDRATFEEPHRLAVGVEHVFVNGTQVLHDGEHTGAAPGRFVHGPGWTGGDDTTGDRQ